MTLRIEIDRLRLTGLDLSPAELHQLVAECKQAIAAELGAARGQLATGSHERIAAGIGRAVAATLDGRAG